MEPLISVIVPAYQSQATIHGCLTHLLAQDGVGFEVIVVDSSPTATAKGVITTHFPQIHYIYSPHHLLPHAARNLGATQASGRLLVFTDPDAYAEPDWLRRLVAAHQQTGAIIAGGVRCYGSRWFDHGVHVTKYAPWLPSGALRPIPIAPTVNVLYPAEIFFANGGFRGDLILGDTELSWRMARCGQPIWFEPQASVAHHHLAHWRDFVRERFERGGASGRLQANEAGWKIWRLWLWVVFSLIPLRLLSHMAQTLRHTLRAGQGRMFLATLPVVLIGRWAWVVGEAWGCLGELRRAKPRLKHSVDA